MLVELVVLVVLVIALTVFGSFDTKVLDVSRAESGVQEILTDPSNGYGANDVTSVRCNGGRNPEIAKGGSFICTVNINGNTRSVDVAFQDDDGTYEVDGPR